MRIRFDGRGNRLLMGGSSEETGLGGPVRRGLRRSRDQSAPDDLVCDSKLGPSEVGQVFDGAAPHEIDLEIIGGEIRRSLAG